MAKHSVFCAATGRSSICGWIFALVLVVIVDRDVPGQVIADGHVDLGVIYENGQLSWRFNGDGATSEGGTTGDLEGLYLPSQLSVRVPDSARYDGPAFPGNANLTGVGAGPLHFLPSSGALAGAPFPGWSWDLGVATPPQVVISQWQNSRITVQLLSAVMPLNGHFSLWTGSSTNYISTFNPSLTNAPNVPPGSNSFVLAAHTHYNWGFTKPGVYDITVRASGTHNTDGFKTADATFRFLVGSQTEPSEPASVSARYAFHSGWTGTQITPWSALDTQTILAKELPTPQVLGLANLISSSHGINGIVFDIGNLGSPAGVSASDFTFQMSPPEVFNAAQPASTWQLAPAPSAFTVTDMGGGIQRILIQWPNSTIVNRWLRSTIKANGATGLSVPEVYYLGHLRGETTGLDGTVYSVGFGADLAPIRAALATNVNASSRVDIDKNGMIQVADIVAMRSNTAKQLTNISIP